MIKITVELNEENISISNAKYADANGGFYTYPIPFIFQVMIQTNLGSERTMVAQLMIVMMLTICALPIWIQQDDSW